MLLICLQCSRQPIASYKISCFLTLILHRLRSVFVYLNRFSVSDGLQVIFRFLIAVIRLIKNVALLPNRNPHTVPYFIICLIWTASILSSLRTVSRSVETNDTALHFDTLYLNYVAHIYGFGLVWDSLKCLNSLLSMLMECNEIHDGHLFVLEFFFCTFSIFGFAS